MDRNDFRQTIITATEYLMTSHNNTCTFSEPIEIKNLVTGEKKKVIPTLSFIEVKE